VAGVEDFASAARDTVGKYFSLVSVLPAAVLTVYVFLLVNSGAWSRHPQASRAFHALAKLNVPEGIGLAVLALAVALVLHPLQVSAVQVLEGYWGSGPVATNLRGVCIAVFRHRYMRLERRHVGASLALEQETCDPTESPSIRHFARLSRREAAIRLLAELPSADEIMPTRLGNVLRFYERRAGLSYGLDAVRVMPYLSRVASADDMAYVNDQRSNLDLAVRMSVTSILAAGLWFLFFWWDGLFLLVALVPSALSYLSYRGAVIAGAEYGRALSVVLALNRFALYERLNLKRPPNAAAERRANRVLNRMLAHRTVSVTYANAEGPVRSLHKPNDQTDGCR
jgi:hypothetical protein